MPAFRVVVNAERLNHPAGSHLLIPTGPDGAHTFEWLLEEASNRCARAFEEDGTLSAFTLEGALLDPSDRICDLLSSGDVIDATWKSASADPSTPSSVPVNSTDGFDWDSGVVTPGLDITQSIDEESPYVESPEEGAFSMLLVVLAPGSTKLERCQIKFVDESVSISEVQQRACELAQLNQVGDTTYRPYLFTEETILDTTDATEQLSLADWGVRDGSTIYVVFQPQSEYVQDSSATVCRRYPHFFKADRLWKPPVKQTDKGLSCFLSALYVLEKKHLQADFGALSEALLGRLCFPPAITALQCVAKRAPMPTGYKQALVQVLYAVFRGYVPVADVEADGHVEADGQVFEHSLTCWTILLDQVDARKKLLADIAANSTDAAPATVNWVSALPLCSLHSSLCSLQTKLVLTALLLMLIAHLLVLTALLCVPDCTPICVDSTSVLLTALLCVPDCTSVCADCTSTKLSLQHCRWRRLTSVVPSARND